MKKSILDGILKTCYKQLISHPQRDCFAHWSFILQGKKIVSYGVNREGEPHIGLGYHHNEYFVQSGFRPKIHSEVDACRRANGPLNGCTFINVRLNKHLQTRISMPCKVCRNLLYSIGCKRCYFTSENGWGSLDL